MSRRGRTSRPQPTGATWDLAFLRVGLVASLIATAVAMVAVGALLSWADAVSVLVGAAVVTAFFTVSGLVVTWAGRVHDSYTLPAALGTFMMKMLLLVAVLRTLPADGWLDLRVLGWTVVVGALLWSVVQARWVWTKPLYYVPPPEPQSVEGPTSGQVHTAAAQPPAVDPETRTTGG